MFFLDKQRFKDWMFIYKLLSCCLIFIFSILTIVFSVFTEFWYVNNSNKDNFYLSAIEQNFEIMLSFWSSQTIFIVNVWFFCALFYHYNQQKNKFTNIYTQINLTIYITITTFIFWMAILFSRITNLDIGINWFWNLSSLSLIFSFLDHSVSPMLMIIFLILTFKKYQFNINFKKQFILVIIYPIIYLIYIYLRATILQVNNVKHFIYPYTILNFNHSIIGISLWINDMLVVMLIIITIIVVSLFYLFLHKFYYQKLKKHKLLIKIS